MRLYIAGITTLLLIVSLVGCDSAVDDTGPEWWGEAELTRNGEPWPAVPTAKEITRGGRPFPALADSFYFQLATFHRDGFQLEDLRFREIPRRADTHHFKSPRVMYDALNGGDATTDQYKAHEDLENWLAIDRFDSATGELHGRVRLTLLPELRSTPGAPDTLRIEGSFSTVIVSEWPECPECSMEEFCTESVENPQESPYCGWSEAEDVAAETEINSFE